MCILKANSLLNSSSHVMYKLVVFLSCISVACVKSSSQSLKELPQVPYPYFFAEQFYEPCKFLYLTVFSAIAAPDLYKNLFHFLQLCVKKRI